MCEVRNPHNEEHRRKRHVQEDCGEKGAGSSPDEAGSFQGKDRAAV